MDSNGRNDASMTSGPGTRRRAGGVWAKRAGLVAGGLLVGGIAAGTVSATAATSSSSAAPTATSSGTSSNAPDGDHDGPRGGHGAALSMSGTVMAVTGTSVTVKTATATTTYAVTSASDIDKNGEAALKDLVVGDAVRFSTMTTSGTSTIDKLHAGDEAKDMPARPSSGTTG